MTQILEHELIKTVFSNPNGEKLLAFWEVVYGQQISYKPDNTPEMTAFNEGERNFLLTIKSLLEMKV